MKEILKIVVSENSEGKYGVQMDFGVVKTDEVSHAAAVSLVAVSKAIFKELDREKIPDWTEKNILMAITFNAVKIMESEEIN